MLHTGFLLSTALERRRKCLEAHLVPEFWTVTNMTDLHEISRVTHWSEWHILERFFKTVQRSKSVPKV